MIRLTITVDSEEAKRALDPAKVDQAVRAWVPRAANETATRMQGIIRERQKTFGRTGILRNSIARQLRSDGFTVMATAPYALLVDQPTREHDIRPRNKKCLAFPRAGGIVTRSANGNVRTRFLFGGKTASGRNRQSFHSAVFAMVVHHPGTRGLRFIEGTEEWARDTLPGMLEAELRRVLQAGGA